MGQKLIVGRSGLAPYEPTAGTREMGEMWSVENGARRLRCALWSHPFGWELRAESKGELARSQVCRTQTEVFKTAEAWKNEAYEKGWR